MGPCTIAIRILDRAAGLAYSPDRPWESMVTTNALSGSRPRVIAISIAQLGAQHEPDWLRVLEVRKSDTYLALAILVVWHGIRFHRAAICRAARTVSATDTTIHTDAMSRSRFDIRMCGLWPRMMFGM